MRPCVTRSPYPPRETQQAASLQAAARNASLVRFGPNTSYDFGAMTPPSGILKGSAKLAAVSPPPPAPEDDLDSGSVSDYSTDADADAPDFLDILNSRTSPKGSGR